MENQILDEGLNTANSGTTKLYTRNAIWGFCFFFSTVFGGVLLRQNLIDVGKKKEGTYVLIASIAISFLTFYLVSLYEKNQITYICNIIGAMILTEVFLKNNIPNYQSYPAKKIWKPLLISLLITIPFVIAMIYVALNELA